MLWYLMTKIGDGKGPSEQLISEFQTAKWDQLRYFVTVA